ncbi:MAG: polysaccharide deacetylase family protein [Anaerolineaceae bacterium]
MKIGDWYQKRGLAFVFKRAKRLTARYSMTPHKAIMRISRCVEELSAQGCSPTFFVPAVVVGRNLQFLKVLQDCGCEIGVHGFQHVDLTSYPPAKSSEKLQRAAEFLLMNGFKMEGFRCPYLSSSEALIRQLPPRLFNYSSNRAIAWHTDGHGEAQERILYSTIERFYHPLAPNAHMRLPWLQDGMVEIPVCVPDDMQLYDGLNFSGEDISAAWVNLLKETHRRGELFNLMFHPELSEFFEAPFLEVLHAARLLDGRVWVTRLQDVGRWWRKMSRFGVSFIKNGGTWHLQLSCDPQATILIRGLDLEVRSQHWDGRYQRLPAPDVQVHGGLLPFIGLAEDVPEWAGESLQRMGYIVLNGEEGRDCCTIIDREFFTDLDNEVALNRKIEQLEIPLIRYWPWPDGARSALCLSGDLDALSLMDYSTRLLPDWVFSKKAIAG